MRIAVSVVVVAALFAFCTLPAQATGPEYRSYRDWIVAKCPETNVAKEQRVFVGYSNQWAIILPYQRELDIRRMLDQTKAKGAEVGIIILRSGAAKPAFQQAVGPEDKPAFILQPLDVICLYDPHAVWE